jgi:predicted deacylase
MGAAIEAPVALINGGERGPRVYIGAAVHGDEVNSVDVLRRVLTSIDPKRLRGSIVCVTIVNPLAFEARHRWAPQDMEDMNRVWPGKVDGKVSERIAHTIFSEAIGPADAVVDLHTGATNMAVHVVYGENHLASRELAQAFGAEILLEERRDDKWERARFNGKLRSVVNARGIPAITPELGKGGSFQESAIRTGVQGLFNVLRHLGMVSGEIVRPERRVTLSGSHLDSLVSSEAGMFVAETTPGAIVESGDRIGYLYRVRDFSVVEEFHALSRSMVLSIVDNPVVDTGGYIATLSSIKSVVG